MIEEVYKCVIQLKILEQKVQNLITDYEKLKNENEQLRNECKTNTEESSQEVS